MNVIQRTDHNQKPATRNSKVVVILNLALVVGSEGRYYACRGANSLHERAE